MRRYLALLLSSYKDLIAKKKRAGAHYAFAVPGVPLP
jgi:hypothetical protein